MLSIGVASSEEFNAKQLIEDSQAGSMTTGVASSEFRKYGGYVALKNVFEANDGTYDSTPFQTTNANS